MKKSKKKGVPFESLPDTILATILEAFRVSLGAFGRHFEKKGGPERHPKNDAKNKSAGKFEPAWEGPRSSL